MIDVRIEVPLEPKPMPRPRTAVRKNAKGRAFATVFTPKAATEWKGQLAVIAKAQMPAEIIDEPVRVDVLFVLRRPKALMRKKDPDGLIWAPKKPDLDNLDKSVLDALSPFWRDDNLVVAGSIYKAYAEKTGRPRVVIRIRSVPELLFDCDPVLGALITKEAV